MRLNVGIRINELKIKASNELWDQLAYLHQADILPYTRPCTTSKLVQTTVISHVECKFQAPSTYGQEVTAHLGEPGGILYPPFWPIRICIAPKDGSVPVGNPRVNTDNLLEWPELVM